MTGTWNVDGAVYGNPVKYACTLKQAGDTLTGTATMDGCVVPPMLNETAVQKQ